MENTKKFRLDLSLIIPVYNRPRELEELLESLTAQTSRDFEVVIVEDGSIDRCMEQAERYKASLDIKYFYKENSGPGPSRNYGFQKAGGNYAVFLDSDCVLPPGYVGVVREALTNAWTDAFGGPDRAGQSFTTLQKAINYAMTSFLTTGGIRGGGEKLDKFYPRSFNMGYSRQVFEATGGFSQMRFGEDIDMSIRILEAGFQTRLIKEAFVYHKRRTSLKQFFKQVYNSGIARINLNKRHPGALKPVHTLPSFFTLGVGLLILLSVLFSPYFLLPIGFFALMAFFDATLRNKSLGVGLLAAAASFIQLTGYGSGFISAFWKRIILKKDEFAAFTQNFYK